MAGKLRSISNQIHWSLAAKAAAFAVAWFFLPYWLFFIFGVLLYFVPTDQAGSAAGPFLAILVLTASVERSLFFLVSFGILFYIVLAVKQLLIVDRRFAYEAAVLFITFLLLQTFYIKVGSGLHAPSLFGAFLIAAIFGVLMGSFLSCFDQGAPDRKGLRRSIACLSALILWQILIAGLFLPLDFTYQSVVVFLVAALMTDLLPEYFFRSLSRKKVLTALSAIFAFLALVLGSARWNL